jgi:hypothetical protein
LCHGAIEAADVAFHFTEVTDFFVELHSQITNCNNNIAICDRRQEKMNRSFWDGLEDAWGEEDIFGSLSAAGLPKIAVRPPERGS